jgi:hypothetical protein
MYKFPNGSVVFHQYIELICLISGIVASKQRDQELTMYEKHLSQAHVMTRAYQKLFPMFRVVDGIVQLPDRNVSHSLLVYRHGGPKAVAFDLVPIGSIPGWVTTAPFFLHESGLAFTEDRIPQIDRVRALAKQVDQLAIALREIQAEVNSIFTS